MLETGIYKSDKTVDAVTGAVTYLWPHIGVLWFNIAGLMMITLGTLMSYYIANTNRPVPAPIGFAMLVMVAIGLIVMGPNGGSFLILPQALFIIYAAYTQDPGPRSHQQ